MRTTRTRNGVSVTVDNMSGRDTQGGWVIEEISVNGQPIEHKSRMHGTVEFAFIVGFGIGATEADKLKRR